jgi:hypothetical protein
MMWNNEANEGNVFIEHLKETSLLPDFVIPWSL